MHKQELVSSEARFVEVIVPGLGLIQQNIIFLQARLIKLNIRVIDYRQL